MKLSAGASGEHTRQFGGRTPSGMHPGMGTTNKLNHRAQYWSGRAKETVGRATGDHDTKNEGRADQAKSSLKDAGEKVKDAFKK